VSRWPRVRLGELGADVRNAVVGGPFGSELTTRDYIEAPGVPVIRGSNLGEDGFIDEGFVYVSEAKAEALRQNQARPGDIAFTQRGTIGQVALIPANARFSRYLISQSQMKLTPDLGRVEPRFLVHYFRSPQAIRFLENSTLATGVPHINLTILRRVPVPLPPLPEQCRIADTLDKADAIRRNRKETITLAKELLRSAFLEMFGDPATNPKGWPVASFGELAAETQLGLVRAADQQGVGRMYPYIRMNAIQADGHLELSGLTRVDGTEREVLSTHLRDGDFLFNTRNSRELVGKAAVFHGDGTFLFNNNILRVRFRSGVEPDFVNAYWQTRAAQRHLEARKAGTTSVFAIYYKSLATLPIPLPPAHFQTRFSELCTAVRRGIAAHEASIREANLLFDSLVVRAFSGRVEFSEEPRC